MDAIFEIQADLTPADVSRISESHMIAVDCEMGGLNPHRDLLYLVQIADPNGNVNLIKSSSWEKAKNLKTVLQDENVMKVFHFAIMDLAFLNRYLSITVKNVYCTKIASKLARTYSNSHSLGSLLEELFGLTKDKKLQMTFWGKQNISPEQIQYAANDVQHLIKIKNELETILFEKGKLPSGITYMELNQKCQQFIPTLTHLWLNGWDFGKEDPESIFGH